MGLAVPNISVKKYLKLMNSGWRKTNRATMKKLRKKSLVGWVLEGEEIVDLSKIQSIPDKEHKIKIRITIERLN